MYFELVDTDIEISNISTIAQIIWPIAYKDILESNQIKYMLDKFLSINAIHENIKDGYTYVLIKENDIRMGFFAYKFINDHIFLSKLYILPKFQKLGIAKSVISHLKNFNQPIRLTVNKYNKIAIMVYEKLGFKRIDSVVTDIGSGFVMDDYIYEKGD